ncbi:unnamed protein product [Polarella glacialis]|uniref:HCP-like protein n=3 Tax=Polarella glacialis TaxID=89957 RepID=A0A813HVJ5_POLGL|nr:unnamed protein product [Polarella glacialis]
MLGISDPDGYEGGFYLQSTPSLASRRLVRTNPGDLVVHSFDLPHGVHVLSGIRYSLLLFAKPSKRSVREGTTPWYSTIATLGDPDALYNKAGDYWRGRNGRAPDLLKAIQLFKQSAEAGHDFAQTSFYLACRDSAQEAEAAALRKKVRGVIRSRSPKKSGKEVKAIVEQFSVSDLRKALSEAGEADPTGPGTEGNPASALILRAMRNCSSISAAYFLNQAAAAGQARAQKILGDALLRGEHIEKDKIWASRWMRMAAESLEVEGAYTFGEMLWHGAGVAKDRQEAVRWFKRSAKAGWPRAQRRIGKLFLKGTLVPKDAKKGKLWLSRAARAGLDVDVEEEEEEEEEVSADAPGVGRKIHWIRAEL